jgi:hypothetical protein
MIKVEPWFLLGEFQLCRGISLCLKVVLGLGDGTGIKSPGVFGPVWPEPVWLHQCHVNTCCMSAKADGTSEQKVKQERFAIVWRHGLK